MTRTENATKRLAKAREDHAAVKQQISDLDKQLRAALLADADGAAAVAYSERREARELEERLALKIALLEPRAGKELCSCEGSATSNDVEGLGRLLKHFEQLKHLNEQRVQRTEIEDAELNELCAKIAFLKQPEFLRSK